jgi:hypothetical protein
MFDADTVNTASVTFAAGVDLSKWSPEYVRSIAGTEEFETPRGTEAFALIHRAYGVARAMVTGPHVSEAEDPGPPSTPAIQSLLASSAAAAAEEDVEIIRAVDAAVQDALNEKRSGGMAKVVTGCDWGGGPATSAEPGKISLAVAATFTSEMPPVEAMGIVAAAVSKMVEAGAESGRLNYSRGDHIEWRASRGVSEPSRREEVERAAEAAATNTN